jgi:hypothetical protein
VPKAPPSGNQAKFSPGAVQRLSSRPKELLASREKSSDVINNTTHRSKPLMERHLDRCDAGEKNAGSDTHVVAEIAHLVWKYFDDEIRAALVEVQEQLRDEPVKSRAMLKRRGKRTK